MSALKELLLAVEKQATELSRSKFSGVTYQDLVRGSSILRTYEFNKNDLFSDIMRHLWTNRDIIAVVETMPNIVFDTQEQVFRITVKQSVDNN